MVDGWQAAAVALDPDLASRVAHLFDATLAEVLSGAVAGVPSGPALRRDDVEIVDLEVDGPGGPLPLRVYRPAQPADRPMPGLVWAHGGGWRYGSLDMPEADSVAQLVAATLPGTVVSVDYRLAPAHRFPAPVDDVLAAHTWVRDGDHDLPVDRSRVALGGASAGAHLAACAALRLRDTGHPPAALVLAYPVTDPLHGPYPERRHPDCPPVLWLDADAVAGLFAGLVGAGTPDEAVPARALLTGLPPTLVTTAEADGLTLQAHDFVRRLRAAGTDVTVHDVGGVLHGYLDTVGASRFADRALAHHVGWLRTTLDPEGNW